MENTKKTGKRNKKNWTKESTEALLDFYAARADEFQHSRKKKTGYKHLLEDMLSAGYADSDTTSTHLEVKIQTLVRAYKYAIDNNNRTGAAPCVAPFMEKMDELFGSKPILTNVHNVTYGAAAIGNSSETSEDNTTQPSDENSDDMQLHTTQPSDENSDDMQLHTTQPSDENSDDLLETTATDVVPSTSTAAASKKRKISRSLYFKMKIEEKQKDRKDKNRKWAEYMEVEKQKQESRNLKLELLKEILNKKKK